MRMFFKPVGLLLTAIITSLPLVISAETPENQKAKAQKPSNTVPQIAQDRYLVMMSGCNDCHTHGYMQLEAKVSEPDGYWGPSEDGFWSAREELYTGRDMAFSFEYSTRHP